MLEQRQRHLRLLEKSVQNSSCPLAVKQGFDTTLQMKMTRRLFKRLA